MSAYNRYYCTSCYNVWDEEQFLPKVLKCGHTYCIKCLRRLLANNQIICPEDMQAQKIQTLELLPTNQELLHPQPQQSQRSFQNLSVHESYETVTQSTTRMNLTDMPQPSIQSIRKPVQVLQKNDLPPQTRQQLLHCSQQLQESYQKFELDQQIHYNEAYRLITQQKRLITDQIQQRFTDFQIKLRNIESQALQEVNMIAIRLEDDIRQMNLRLDKQTIQEILSLKERIDQLLLLSNDKLNRQVDLVQTLSQQTQILIQDLLQQENVMVQQLIDQKMKVSFNQTVYDMIPNYCKIGDSIQEKTQQQQQQQQNKKTNRKVHTEQSISQDKFIQKSPTKQNDNSNSKPNQYSHNAQHYEENYERLNTRQLTFGRSYNDVRRSVESLRSSSGSKLYESTGINLIENKLLNGIPIDKLDLTNQNLNDNDIQTLVKMILQSQSQISSIKLVKNRITDIGFGQLIRLLQQRTDVHTINLSNNCCTENSIEMIERRVQKLRGKTIYLSNCKINNLTLLRVKQNQLQASGVMLYL